MRTSVSITEIIDRAPHVLICRYAVPINLYYYGLRDTTSSYAIIFVNLIPLFTFVLSLMFR